MKHDIKTFVDQCHTCQVNKVSLFSPVIMLQPLPIPDRIWEEIPLDFIEGLPMSHGFNRILLVVDRLSSVILFH